MRMNRLIAVLCVLFAVPLGGCSLFAGSTQMIAVSATDPDADLYVDNQLIGRGAGSVSLKKNKGHVVVARVGDRAGTAIIDKSISTTGVLDIVGGLLILIPFLGVVSPGFWTLEPETVVVAIPPAPVAAPVAQSAGQ